MDFSYSEKVSELQRRLSAFMDEHIYPAERHFDQEVDRNRRDGNPWRTSQVMEDLKRKARAQQLWNLFLPESAHGAGLTNLEYAPLCEIMSWRVTPHRSSNSAGWCPCSKAASVRHSP
jgi:acyl-CoA dehydrogenase